MVSSMLDLIFVEELTGTWAFKDKTDFTVEILQSTPNTIHYDWFTDSNGLCSVGTLSRKDFLTHFIKVPDE